MGGIEMDQKMLFSLVWFRRENMKERKQSGRKSLRALSFRFGRKIEERKGENMLQILNYSFIPQSCYPSRSSKRKKEKKFVIQVK